MPSGYTAIAEPEAGFARHDVAAAETMSTARRPWLMRRGNHVTAASWRQSPAWPYWGFVHLALADTAKIARQRQPELLLRCADAAMIDKPP
jgi:hypothetical protein